MGTIKSFTDIPQSEKLAEILPLESADMFYTSLNSDYPWVWIDRHLMGVEDIPCWSLAALLNVLPLEIETHKQTDGYKIYYYVESYMKRMGKEIYLSTERHENFVDACVEMILKLHELNLL